MNPCSGLSSAIVVLSDHPASYSLALHLPRNNVNSATQLCLHSLGDRMSWEYLGLPFSKDCRDTNRVKIGKSSPQTAQNHNWLALTSPSAQVSWIHEIFFLWSFMGSGWYVSQIAWLAFVHYFGQFQSQIQYLPFLILFLDIYV